MRSVQGLEGSIIRMSRCLKHVGEFKPFIINVTLLEGNQTLNHVLIYEHFLVLLLVALKKIETKRKIKIKMKKSNNASPFVRTT